jgi:hypothetical protein
MAEASETLLDCDYVNLIKMTNISPTIFVPVIRTCYDSGSRGYEQQRIMSNPASTTGKSRRGTRRDQLHPKEC